MSVANRNIILRDGWFFHKGELERVPETDHNSTYRSNMAGFGLSLFNMFGEGVEWKNVKMPHDWLTEEGFDTSAAVASGFKRRETAWYYLEFELENEEVEEALLVFEGVLGHSTVYVNGTIAVRSFTGYTKFSCDVEPYLNKGKNTIAVYVDGRRREGWWYEGAGIYRPVYLELRRHQKFDSQDYFIRSEKNENGFNIHTTLDVFGVEDGTYSVKVTAFDKEGNIVAEDKTTAANKTDIVQNIENPILWSPECPYLYTVKCELIKDEEVYDTITQKVGLRTIEWKNDGMYLNGSRYQIKGICCHQDHNGVGAATTKELIDYRLDILKDLGANAYRCAHHAVSDDVLNFCDEKGIFVMAENRNFSVCTDVLKQLEALVKQARNHPSVFMYSLFNEERWQSEPQGPRIFRKMHKHLLKYDDTRIVAGAQSCGALNTEEYNTTYVMDIVGANYNLPDYDKIHEKFPDKCILGTENCPTFATRGIYKTEGEYYANYGDEWPKDWSQSIEETMETVMARPFVAGCFAWSGFDYRGEPQPKVWPSVSSHWGFTDYCGFYKDTAYLLMSYYKTEPLVHLLPHWNWNDGETVRVCTYTNADTVELFLNGNSLGEKKANRMRAEWQVPFKKGSIKAVAKRGDVIVSDERHTVGEPYALKLVNVAKKGYDNRIVNVFAVDKNGDVIPDYCGEVSFDYPEGANMGVGNGDPTNHISERSDKIPLFNGMAQIILRGGKGKLTAKAEGLKEAEISLI